MAKNLDIDKVNKDENLLFIHDELCATIILCMNYCFKKLLVLLNLKIYFDEKNKIITINSIENTYINNDDGKVKYFTNKNYLDKDEDENDIEI